MSAGVLGMIRHDVSRIVRGPTGRVTFLYVLPHWFFTQVHSERPLHTAQSTGSAHRDRSGQLGEAVERHVRKGTQHMHAYMHAPMPVHIIARALARVYSVCVCAFKID